MELLQWPRRFMHEELLHFSWHIPLIVRHIVFVKSILSNEIHPFVKWNGCSQLFFCVPFTVKSSTMNPLHFNNESFPPSSSCLPLYHSSSRHIFFCIPSVSVLLTKVLSHLCCSVVLQNTTNDRTAWVTYAWPANIHYKNV